METHRKTPGVRALLAASLVIGCTALAGVVWVSQGLDAQRDAAAQAASRPRTARPLQVVPKNELPSEGRLSSGERGVIARSVEAVQDVPPEIRMTRLQDELTRLRESLYASNQEAARLQEQVRELTGAMDHMLAGGGGFEALIEMKAGEELAELMRQVPLRAGQLEAVRKLIAAGCRKRYQPVPSDAAAGASDGAYLTLPVSPWGFPTMEEGKGILALLDPDQQEAYRKWEANHLALGQFSVAMSQGITLEVGEVQFGGTFKLGACDQWELVPAETPPGQDDTGKKPDPK